MSQAWKGDWHARIYSCVKRLGYNNVRDFVVSRPCKTWLELADELDRQAVAGIQVQRLVYEEALERNDILGFAKDCIVRELWRRIPTGWSTGDEFLSKVSGAYAGWITSLEDSYQDHADRAWDWLKEQPIPEGWLPEGSNDPWIEAMFRETGFPGADKTHKPES